MFCSCLVLSFDVCIVTITWSLLFVVIALWLSVWLGRLLLHLVARVLYWRSCVSLYFISWWGNIWLYSWMCYLGLNPLVKLHTLHGSVVPAGVTVLLGLCNPPRRGRGEPAKPGLLYPLLWIPCCAIVSELSGSWSRVGSKAYYLESWVTCCDRQD
jgi:hypothetical protein